MIDAHCHLDFYSNPNKIAEKSEKNKIITIGVTNLPSHFEVGYKHVKNYKNVRLALGLHPLLAKQHEKEYNKFKKLISKTSYIGEIGLDFSKEGISTKVKQIESFKFVLENVKDKSKILSLHSRKAENMVLEIISDYKINNAIFHWYSGNLLTLEKIIQKGYYFSINPAMIRSQKGKEIIKNIPRHLILTETDGPYIKVKGRIVEPIDVKHVINYLSELWKIDINETYKQVRKNFKKIINNLK